MIGVTKKENRWLLLAMLFYAGMLSLWSVVQLASGNADCCQTVGSLQHAFYFHPFLSEWLAKGIRSTTGMWGSVIVGQVLFPVLTLYFLISIFRRHVTLLWSMALALLAVAVSILPSLFNGLAGNADGILAATVKALGGLQGLLVLGVRGDASLDASH